MAIHTLTSKLTVVAKGHKVGLNKVPTWYRDELGNYHAEWYGAVVGAVGEDGKYHSYQWNISPDEAEAFGNMLIGTTFKVVLRDKTKTSQVVADDGSVSEVTVADVTPSADGGVLYHNTVCEQIEVAHEGSIKRPRMVQYFADVEAPAKTANGGSQG